MTDIQWKTGATVLDLVVDEHGPVRVRGLRPGGPDAGPATVSEVAGPATVSEVAGPATVSEVAVPLVELNAVGGGRLGNSASAQHRPYAAALALRYTGHETVATPHGERLVVDQRDPVRGLSVRTSIQHHRGTSVLRLWHELRNDGTEPMVLGYASTLSLTGFTGGTGISAGIALAEARNAWSAELRWQRLTPEQAGIVDNGEGGADPGIATSRARHTVTAAGSWSTGGSLPVGGIELVAPGGESGGEPGAESGGAPGTAWVWQVEHCGGWHWEIADLHRDLYLQVSGPTDAEHRWHQPLAPGERFETVPVAIAVVAGDLTDGLRELTAYRRRMRRPARDAETLPIIFNDYMNCLWGDPTQQRLAPLIAAAAEVGCEYFVIDAGWYAAVDEGWWDTVGDWQPSAARFPDGIAATTRRIVDAGMVPGLWLEPEVVGVRSPLADQLPPEAFFQAGGQPVAEHGRYHLDFRCPEVTAHLDSVVDRLVGEYGVGYLKLDYNISLPGTDALGESLGAGLLGHNRAYLAWLDRVLDRHPDLVLENCASGGMRMDYALLSRLALQSTSDQRDPLRYASIAAAAPSAVTPEQGAVWAFAAPEHTPEQAAFSLVNAALGRVHLSGRIDETSRTQRAMVRAALDAYREYRGLLATGLPYWPLGLPGWYDPWLALALATEDECLLAVWCRRPEGGKVSLPLPHLAGTGWRLAPVFPTDLPGELRWCAEEGVVTVSLPVGPAARLVRLWR